MYVNLLLYHYLITKINFKFSSFHYKYYQVMCVWYLFFCWTTLLAVLANTTVLVYWRYLQCLPCRMIIYYNTMIYIWLDTRLDDICRISLYGYHSPSSTSPHLTWQSDIYKYLKTKLRITCHCWLAWVHLLYTDFILSTNLDVLALMEA